MENKQPTEKKPQPARRGNRKQPNTQSSAKQERNPQQTNRRRKKPSTESSADPTARRRQQSGGARRAKPRKAKRPLFAGVRTASSTSKYALFEVEEIVVYLLSFCQAKTLANLAGVSLYFRRIVNDPRLWDKLIDEQLSKDERLPTVKNPSALSVRGSMGLFSQLTLYTGLSWRSCCCQNEANAHIGEGDTSTATDWSIRLLYLPPLSQVMAIWSLVHKRHSELREV